VQERRIVTVIETLSSLALDPVAVATLAYLVGTAACAAGSVMLEMWRRRRSRAALR
jgi:hypothetical protein